MRILSLSVKAFGKLRDVELTFRNGINVIENVNGFGKTTLANFIRAMLYGFAYSRTKNGVDAQRFAPWGVSDKFGGSMTVEHNGEIYRIERFFGKTARGEEMLFLNANTNKPINISCSIGEYLLGLTADSYDRSAYFPQEAVELYSNDNFEAKLANLVENSEVDYDKTQKIIREYRKNLKFERGDGGEIYRLNLEKMRLERELDNALQAERRSVQIEERLAQITAEKHAIAAKQTECKKTLDKLKHQLAAKSLTEADRQTLAKIAELEGRIARVPSDIEHAKQHLDKLANDIADVKDVVKPRIYPNMMWLIISCVLAVVGIAMYFVIPKPWNFVSGSVLILLGIAGAIVSFTKKGAATLPAGEKDALISEYIRIAGKYVYTANLDYNAVVKAFWKCYSDYNGDKRELDALRGAVKKTDGGEAVLQREIDIAEKELETAAEQFACLAGEEGRLTQEGQSLNFDSIAPKEQIEKINAQITEAEKKYYVAGVVSSLLAEAKDRLSASYLPRLCSRCGQLLRQVTNGDYDVIIDRSFTVQIRQDGQTKPMGEFSRGIREITLLCFRIALAELLYDGQIPFMIADDAFVNFDENNFVRATDLLKSVAEHGQVIYFTCHKRTGSLLK